MRLRVSGACICPPPSASGDRREPKLSSLTTTKRPASFRGAILTAVFAPDGVVRQSTDLFWSRRQRGVRGRRDEHRQLCRSRLCPSDGILTPILFYFEVARNGQISSESHRLSNVVHRLKIVRSSHIVLKHREA
jgi:hypothetical protein